MKSAPSGTAAFALLAVATGVAAGIAGMVELQLLHWCQRIGYGYGFDPSEPVPSFLQGVTASPPWRRVLAMTAAGLLAGFGWWALRSRGRKLVSIAASVRPGGPEMPSAETLIDALLQAITIGLGSPLGREVAPRQIAAVLTGWLARAARLSSEDRRVLVACGAGAGLAAVYNVPLGGALFAMEGLLGTLSAPAVIAAMASSSIAARIAWIGLGNEAPYTVPSLPAGAPLLVWSFAVGPVFGLLAHGFARSASAAAARAPRGVRLVPSCLVAFVAMGLMATRFPQILGNGRGPTQLAFAGQVSPALAATLVALKLLAVLLALRAGAVGGTLTPSLALGGLLSTSLAGVWGLVWPHAPAAAFAIVGAAAFLASSQKMPLTATALVIEFTRVDHDFFFPILIAASGAAAARLTCVQWEERRKSTIAANEDRVHEG
jgi:H+/Cl- antiporter ClcA